MASVSTNKKTEARRVLFVSTDGTRKALHVGKVTMATAVEIGAHVEHLVRCQQAREDFRQSTQQWIEHVRRQWPRLATRLVKLGLIRETVGSSAALQQLDMCFADFADQLIAARTDLKPNTIRLWRQTAVRIREFHGSLLISGVTAKHASDFRRWLLSPSDKGGAGYASASAGKHMTLAKSFLKEAVDAGIIDANPSGKIVIDRQRNRTRQRFIDSSVITQVISLCADPEMQAVIALSRWGNLRSSRQTELEERFPRKTVCEWMGNSEQVTDQHYLQVRDEHFDRAANG